MIQSWSSQAHFRLPQHGIAKDSTADIFSSADYLEYPDGIICKECLCQTYTLTLSQDGLKLQCILCTISSLHRHVKSIPESLLQALCKLQ